MKKWVEFFIFLTCLINSLFCEAQNMNKIDSLTKVLNSTIADTEKVNIMNALAFEYLYSAPDKSLTYAKQAFVKSKSISFEKGIGASYNSIGNVSLYSGNYDSALIHYSNSLKIFDSIGEKKLTAMCLNNIGTAYHLKGDYNKTINFYTQSLKIREDLNDKQGASDCMNNMGVVYMDQGNFSKALEYFFKTLPIKKELGDKRGIASILSNIGITYFYKSELSIKTKNEDILISIDCFKKALQIYIELGNIKGMADCQINLTSKYFYLKKYEESLKFAKDARLNYEKINDKRGISFCYINMADVHTEKKEYSEAIEFLNLSLNIKKEIGEKMGIGECYYKLGKIYLEQKNYSQALKYFYDYLPIAQEMESLEDLRSCYKYLSLIYSNLNNYKKAYDYHVLFKQMQDSLINTDNTKKITQLEMNYQFQQKEREQELIQQQKDAVKRMELKRQKLFKNAFIIGFFLTLLFSFFIFRSYRLSRKKSIILAKQKSEILEKNAILFHQKEEITSQRDEIEKQRDEIEIQHHLIEKKNKNITDSILYAQRIQRAILPLDEKLDKILKDYFVFFHPKDIVSGDFYWAEHYTNTKSETISLFAAIDCTGHGVPGAFMSLLGYNGLSQAISENKLIRPSEILDFLSNYIKDILRHHKEDRTVKDGMDLFLCSLNRNTLLLEYAGVHNPAYIVRNGEVLTLKPDTHSIGDPFSDWFKGYNNHQIALQKNDCIYLFTDGFIDQFGGEGRKKFMKKRFRELLIDIHLLSMSEQKMELEKVFKQWKGDNIQIDDNLIIGVRI